MTIPTSSASGEQIKTVGFWYITFNLNDVSENVIVIQGVLHLLTSSFTLLFVNQLDKNGF